MSQNPNHGKITKPTYVHADKQLSRFARKRLDRLTWHQRRIGTGCDLRVGEKRRRFVQKLAQKLLAIEGVIPHGQTHFLRVNAQTLRDCIWKSDQTRRKPLIAAELIKDVSFPLRCGCDIEFAAAAEQTREHRRPDLAVECVHRKLIEYDVARKAARRLRIGRQTDDADPARKHDLELLDAEILEEPVVVVIVGDL